MKKSTRYVVLIISCLLVITYFVPMWFIDLEAPQYPEGMGLKIWLNKMSGDLNTINNLNHYIGMKEIHPESIPELKIMPYLIGILMGGGLLVFFVNKKWLFAAWAIFFMAIGITGLVDFYLWGYDYGHNLDPRAAIKVPGMSYQPPVIGSKQLLNFNAHSYPDIGGTIIMGGALLSLIFLMVELNCRCAVCCFLNKKLTLGKVQPLPEMKTGSIAVIFLTSIFITSCNKNPQPIQYGQDVCALCKMTITDSRYGTELITKKGKKFKFDSVECLINYVAYGKEKKQNIHSLYITDFANPTQFVNAQEAYFIISPNFQSPMGANLTAFSNKDEVEKFQKQYNGKILNWQQTFEEIGRINDEI